LTKTHIFNCRYFKIYTRLTSSDDISILPVLTAYAKPSAALAFLQQLATTNSGDVNFRESIVKATYQAFLKAEPTLVKLTMADLDNISRPTGYYDVVSGSTTNTTRDTTHPNTFFAVLKNTINLSLDVEAARLLYHGLPDLPASESPIWNKWRTLFDFVEQLISTVQNSRNENVLATVRSFSLAITRSPAVSLAQKRPVEPRDWRRSTDHSCTTAACNELRRFLANPTQAVGRFRYSERDRKHMQHSLPYEDYKFETLRIGSPLTLVVHKTNNEYLRLESRWKQDVKQMLDRIRRWRADVKFQAVLGEEIVKLEEVERWLDGTGAPPMQGVDRASGRPFQPMSASAQNHRAAALGDGMRTKTEIIDLTEGMDD